MMLENKVHEVPEGPRRSVWPMGRFFSVFLREEQVGINSHQNDGLPGASPRHTYTHQLQSAEKQRQESPNHFDEGLLLATVKVVITNAN